MLSVMKLDREELKKLYGEVSEAFDVVRDAWHNVIGFSFRKYYGTGKRSSRVIKVSLKAAKRTAEHLEEADFFALLYDNAERVEDIKISAGKVIAFRLDKKLYKTDKPNVPKLFQTLDYKDFLTVSRGRFYRVDTRLRNGYFSGLIGTNNGGIQHYKKNKADMTLYDVDFNSAYPACFSQPLPSGKFYTSEEWAELPEAEKRSYTKFYDIRIKSLSNSFGIFMPPPPYVEYADFDFLLQKTSSYMIVSEPRKQLIELIYGAEAYTVRGIWYVKTKMYNKLLKAVTSLYNDIQDAKKRGNEEQKKRLKIALNSLIGNFGRRDEEKRVIGVSRVDNGIFSDSLRLEWSEATRKEKPNYLPLPMYINDFTALRLFRLLTENPVTRLCFNTDGGIIALPRGYRIITSKRIGWLKAEEIQDAELHEVSILYARPLVFDRATEKVYNSNMTFYRDGAFFCSEVYDINTRHGFERYEHIYPLPVHKWKSFNLRRSELIIKLKDNDVYKQMKRLGRRPDPEEGEAAALAWELKAEAMRRAGEDFDRLANPYDSGVNEVRHAPPRVEKFEQLSIFDKDFIKNT